MLVYVLIFELSKVIERKQFGLSELTVVQEPETGISVLVVHSK